MQWNDVAKVFEVDGGLLDIYVSKTSVSDWDSLISLCSGFGRVTYTRDGEETPLPTSAAKLLDDREHSHCMSVELGGPVANIHFFVTDEIELDLDPSEIQSQAALDDVLNFCSKLSQEIERDVRITPESTPETILLYYSAKEQTWRIPKQL